MPLVTQYPNGTVGPQGPAGPGVPNGGTTGQVLAKASNANQDTHWITGGGGGGGGVQVATVHVSSAEILALRTTPIVLLPAVSGNAAIVNGIAVAYVAGSTPYTDHGSHLLIDTATEAAVWFDFATSGFWDQASSQMVVQGCGINGGQSGSDALSNFSDTDVHLHASVANPTLGDGTLVVTVSYFLAPTS